MRCLCKSLCECLRRASEMPWNALLMPSKCLQSLLWWWKFQLRSAKKRLHLMKDGFHHSLLWGLKGMTYHLFKAKSSVVLVISFHEWIHVNDAKSVTHKVLQSYILCSYVIQCRPTACTLYNQYIVYESHESLRVFSMGQSHLDNLIHDDLILSFQLYDVKFLIQFNPCNRISM